MRVTEVTTARHAADRGKRELLHRVRLTLPQTVCLNDPRRTTLWRDGNRLGKSYVAAYEIVHRCRGTHPGIATHTPPIRVICVSYSLQQMVPLMEALWTLLPKSEIDPRNGFEPGRGITGKPARIVFTSGPGKGSVINFGTYKAGSKAVAGGAYHLVVCDEPPTSQMYGELKPRLLTTDGTFRLYFTPTPGSPNLDWLREKVKDGEVAEHNFGLLERNTWQIGAPRPMLYQERIDSEVRTWLANERRMREFGDWDPVVSDPLLTLFDRDRNVRSFGLDEVRGWTLSVGMDQGVAAGKQTAMLVATMDEGKPTAQARWIDEYRPEVATTTTDDARGVLDMLKRRGLSYDDVDHWVGDRPAGDARKLVQKTNKEIRRRMAVELGRDSKTLKKIVTPRKYQGSEMDGLRTINQLFGGMVGTSARGVVHTRCAGFVQFCLTYRGHPKDPIKDIGDGGRYPVERLIKYSSGETGGGYAFYS